MTLSNKQKLEELEYCAILQGFGLDLRPLYKDPVLDLLIYLKLRQILRENKK